MLLYSSAPAARSFCSIRFLDLGHVHLGRIPAASQKCRKRGGSPRPLPLLLPPQHIYQKRNPTDKQTGANKKKGLKKKKHLTPPPLPLLQKEQRRKEKERENAKRFFFKKKKERKEGTHFRFVVLSAPPPPFLLLP
eukprot:Sspe_Gene.97257::Locus_70874_Transcript_2_3_Confidence_0.500_Length_1460::g.97257::m.97257